jgi:hypothetical protein
MQNVGSAARDGAGVGPELDAFYNATPSHLKDLNRATARSNLQAEYVPIAEPGTGDLLLPVAKRLHRAQGISQLRGFFESFSIGCRPHAVKQSLDELVVTAFEQQSRVRDRDSVLIFGADFRHAGCQAPFDVVLEAGAAALSGNHLVA